MRCSAPQLLNLPKYGLKRMCACASFTLSRWFYFTMAVTVYIYVCRQFYDGTVIMTQARHGQNSHEIQKTGFFTLSVSFSGAILMLNGRPRSENSKLALRLSQMRQLPQQSCNTLSAIGLSHSGEVRLYILILVYHIYPSSRDSWTDCCKYPCYGSLGPRKWFCSLFIVLRILTPIQNFPFFSRLYSYWQYRRRGSKISVFGCFWSSAKNCV
jgi:hypothetical protein